MKKTLLFFIVILLLSVYPQNISSSTTAINADINMKMIDAYIQREMQNGKIPGLSLGIVYGDEIMYLQGYGTANDQMDAVTPQTPFYIGSIGKTFTALAIRQLANEGLLDLNKTVSAYIPWFTLKDEYGVEIRINQLLNHTSGLSTNSGNLPFAYNEKYTIEEMVRLVSKKAVLDRPVGISEEYSNMNYIILGLIVEYVSGESFDEYSKNHIYAPIGMTQTVHSLKEARANGFAQGYRKVNNLLLRSDLPHPTPQIPAGYQISTAQDMADYLKVYLNNGYINGNSLLPNNQLPLPENLFTAFDKDALYYSIYWDLTTDKTNTAYNGFYGHGGATPNMNSMLLINQQYRCGIIVLTNVRDFTGDSPISAASIANGITDLLLGIPIKPSASVPSYPQIYVYWGILILFAVWRFGSVWHLRRRKRQKQTIKLQVIAAALIDLSIPMGLWFGLPLLYNNNWAYFLNATPEYARSLLAVSIALAISAFVKAVLLIKKARRIKSIP